MENIKSLEDWKEVTLDDIYEIKQGKHLSLNELSDDGYAVYGANGRVGHYNDYMYEEPTLLITCRGATCGSINLTDAKSWVTGNSIALIPKEEIDINFMRYLLTYTSFSDVISGSAQPQIIATTLRKKKATIPSLETQKKIAEVLEKAENALEKRKEANRLLDGLVKSRFIEMFGDPIINQLGWVKGKIRDIVSEVKYGTSKPALEGGKYTYLRMNNITYDGHLDLSNLKYIDIQDNEIEKCIVRKGDVLFNRTNSKELVGKTCVFDIDDEMVIAGYIIRVRTNEKVIPVYLSAVLNSAYGKNTLFNMCKAIVGQANINAQELQNIEILVPPIELQNQFADFVNQVDKLKFEMEESLKELENLFNSLMQRAFKGELFN